MKKLFISMLSLLIVSASVGCGNLRDYPYKAEAVELGIPLEGRYALGNVARCAWDVEVYDNRLYVGSGDYDKNAGPVDMFSYDIKNKKWEYNGNLPDEEISRFCILNGVLTATGIDPRDGWDYGNFYTLENGEWKINRNITGGIHNFDMAEFDNKLFAGLGVKETDFPAAVSADGGKSWSQLPFYRGGKPINDVWDSVVRVYDFFVFKNRLYAHYRINDGNESKSEIYLYENGAFNYFSSVVSGMKRQKTSYHYINQKLEFNGRYFFATGHLYSTKDMITAEEITLKPNTQIVDLRVINDTLYTLCNEEKTAGDGSKYYRVSVWYSKSGYEGDFRQMFFYDYENRALSFTYHDGVFYFGMGFGSAAKDVFYVSNGMILAVENRV